METANRSTFWIALGLVGAFLLGGLTATAGIAVTRVAASALSARAEFAHAGPMQMMDARSEHPECEMMPESSGEQTPGMRRPGMQLDGDDDVDSRPMRPGSRGEFEDSYGESLEESCPMWGRF